MELIFGLIGAVGTFLGIPASIIAIRDRRKLKRVEKDRDIAHEQLDLAQKAPTNTTIDRTAVEKYLSADPTLKDESNRSCFDVGPMIEAICSSNALGLGKGETYLGLDIAALFGGSRENQEIFIRHIQNGITEFIRKSDAITDPVELENTSGNSRVVFGEPTFRNLFKETLEAIQRRQFQIISIGDDRDLTSRLTNGSQLLIFSSFADERTVELLVQRLARLNEIFPKSPPSIASIFVLLATKEAKDRLTAMNVHGNHVWIPYVIDLGKR